MFGDSDGGSSSARAVMRPFASPRSTGYQPVDARGHLEVALWSFRAHATLVWVLLPIFVAAQIFVPRLRPTPEHGYPALSLLVVALVVSHHAVAESRAWASVRGMLSRPELVVMQQTRVLERRRWLVLLGIMEDLDVYTDLAFPYFAYVCDEAIHGRWLRSWEAIPMIGNTLVMILERWRFWGVSAMCFGVAWLGALAAVLRLCCSEDGAGTSSAQNLFQDPAVEGCYEHSQSFSGDGTPRMSGESYFDIARSAETALMPSVSLLCEEMGAQRSHVFEQKLVSGGSEHALKERMKARVEVQLGRRTLDTMEMYELENEHERERVDMARKAFFTLLLLGRTFIGNALQMWLQASFFALTFEYLGKEASWKILIGIALSGLQILVRCGRAASALGVLGAPFLGINLLVMLWAGVKIYFAYMCDSHVWGIATGCVEMHA